MRTTAEIRKDIIEASENYQTITDTAWCIMPDCNTDAPGTSEVIADIKEHLRSLYKEMLNAYKAEKMDIGSS